VSTIDLVVILLIVPCLILVFASSLIWIDKIKSISYPYTTHNNQPIFTALYQKTGSITNNSLVKYALDKINYDRTKFNLPQLQLSDNNAAHVQSEELLETKYQHPSHWTTDGMKPYMLYSTYNGTSYVEQNVAIRGYDNSTIYKCKHKALHCEKIDPYSEIDNAERKMMYNDTVCCKNAHRNNILDIHHTNVSIGISYDRYYFAFVQNFENNYIHLTKPITRDNRHIEISGIKQKNGTLDNIGVYFDALPNHLTYEENREKNSYALGTLLASVVKPLPLFFNYKKPSNYTLIVADKWFQNTQSVNITFDLSSVLKGMGVYTIVTYYKDGVSRFPATTYSIFLKSQV